VNGGPDAFCPLCRCWAHESRRGRRRHVRGRSEWSQVNDLSDQQLRQVVRDMVAIDRAVATFRGGLDEQATEFHSPANGQRNGRSA
jgi:hypothetical protein